MRRVALVLVGSRNLNKRTCRFVESLRDSGFDPVLVGLPRRPWGTTGIEDPTLVARRGAVTLRSTDPGRRVPRRPALVVCMHWATLPVSLLLKRLLGAAVVYDEHDDYELLALEARGPAWANRARSWWIGRIHAWCLPHVDLVTCIRLAGGQLQQHLRTLAPAVVELHNYPSQRWGAHDRDPARSDGSIAIVYVGGVWEVKGCRAMLDAFLLIAGTRSLPPLTLHVFGRGDPDLEHALDASPGVTFHGSSSYEDIVGFLTGHDCLGLVLLEATPRYSLVSTNCHKLYEYLAAGVPVLATEVGELADIVATLDGGWTIEPGFDVAELAGKLCEIVARPDELRRRGDAAAAAVQRDGLWWEREWQKVGARPPVNRGDHL